MAPPRNRSRRRGYDIRRLYCLAANSIWVPHHLTIIYVTLPTRSIRGMTSIRSAKSLNASGIQTATPVTFPILPARSGRKTSSTRPEPQKMKTRFKRLPSSKIVQLSPQRRQKLAITSTTQLATSIVVGQRVLSSDMQHRAGSHNDPHDTNMPEASWSRPR